MSCWQLALSRAPSAAGRPAVGSWRIAAAGLVVLAIVAHGRSVTGGFIWDDDFYVTQNLTLRSMDGLRRIWFEPLATPQYYPLVHTTYWLEYRVWGLDSRGYHAVNVTLHAAASVALWALLAKLAVPAAWFGAALFAVHPVGVESVAWVTERKNTLSVVMAMLAASCWLRYRFGRGPISAVSTDSAAAAFAVADSRQRRAWLAAAIGLFALAILSKTVAVMLVGMLGIIVWWKTGTIRKADAAGLFPLVVIGLPLAMLTVWLEKHHVGATGIDWNLATLDRLLIAGRATAFYAGKLVWPQALAFFYPRWRVDWHEPWQWIFPGACAAILVLAWRYRGTIGRGPVAAVAMYICGLFPALGFFDVYPFKYSFVADHFQYHAMPVALAAGGAVSALVRPQLAANAVRTGVLAGLAALACIRCAAFHDLEALYLDTLAKNPSSAAAAHNLGSEYMFEGRTEEAERYLTQGAEQALFADERSRSLASLALIALSRGRAAEAVPLARKAERTDSTRRARGVLALALVRAGETEEADELIAVAGSNPAPEMRMAAAESALSRRDIATALEYFTAFVNREDPDEKNSALLEAGITLAEYEFMDEAVTLLASVSGSGPRAAKAQINIGICRARQGRFDEAAEHFRTAVNNDPGSVEAHANLGKALAAAGRHNEARSEFERARQLSSPSHPSGPGKAKPRIAVPFSR